VATRGIAYCCGAEFVGVNPCASFSDVECFNTKQLQLEPRRTGYYLEFNPKDTVLTLNFTLPLKQPVKAKDLVVEVYDREFFVDFSFAEKNAAKLVGAPARCKLSVVNPEQMDATLSQQLAQLGADQRDPTLTVGSQYANKLV
jgi:ABC-type uncharacterized transport system substrate-binding protein